GVQSGTIVGMEALLRWDFPGSGMISPADFIPLAEESSLIVPIGSWVLRTACQQTKVWHQAGFTHLKVAVNLSARQLQEKQLFSSIQQALDESGLSPEYLELEITESMMMENMSEVTALLTQIDQIGIRLSLDDFGTGYSSLSHLRRFPIRSLKIDRSFINGINDVRDADGEAIVKTIILMAHQLGMTVIAEGVETAYQCVFLRDNGCDQIQGYYYSKPLPVDAFDRMLHHRRALHCH
ncbi:MAG: EAL domain-containing protein, partial [Magnetococcales bacterium]|nr:EAL domain-containing protein [Magnetococcales bacterium]